MPTVKDQAIGSWEAAAVLGVHWTQPAVMVKKGLLKSRLLKSPTTKGASRSFAIYSLADCNAEFADYEDAQATRTRRRPRSYTDLRPDELRRLKAVDPQIEFDDAIGAAEAAEIMGCHWTWPPRIARRGEIIGRVPHNGRDDKLEDRVWIFSRRSCEANAAAAKAQVHAGTKVGRPRRGIVKKTLAK
jgi:hypothetical protein